MARVLVRDIGTTPLGDAPSDVTASGDVRVSPVLAGHRDPVHLHSYACGAGAQLLWRDAGLGRIIYVREGAVEAAGISVGKGGSITIEHGATLSITVTVSAELIVFGVMESAIADGDSSVARVGGHVHVLTPANVPRCIDFDGDSRVGGALFADAACPTCELWLHETIVHRAGQGTPIHSHPEDEVIVLIEGTIILGRKCFGPGTAISVARNTLYGFQAGAQGLTFINFRPRSPIYIPADRSRPEIDERQFYLTKMPPPAPVTIASPTVAEH